MTAGAAAWNGLAKSIGRRTTAAGEQRRMRISDVASARLTSKGELLQISSAIKGGIMKIRLVAVSLVALTIAGCAKAPESISASYVSEVGYQSWSCAQLATEQQRLSSAYATAAQQQEKARTNDVVGVLLIGLPVSSLSGDNIAPEIARLKGEQEAVRKAMIAKKCELKSS